MRVLDRKLIQDLKRIWAQSLAVALVMACGVATILLAVGSYRSLEETRSVYYDRYRFASVFASVTRAPTTLKNDIANIPGVSAVELRVMKSVVIDMPLMAEPATGLVISIPDLHEPEVNLLYLRRGRLPDGPRDNEVAVEEGFALAHDLKVGDGFHTTINGHRRWLKVTGIVLSPEFIYALGPGDMVPDPRRFGILFMSMRQLRGLFDMTGAFNQVSLATMRHSDTERIVDTLDRILSPYGGTGGYDRDEHVSHAFLDAELSQLGGMAKVIPPVFLLISAFLVNMILSRLIALEREQIGLLKAVGYSDLDIGLHYIKLVAVISLAGLLIGGVAGTLLGEGLTRLYARFYSFPFLVFIQNLDVYLIAIVVSLAAATGGAAKAILSVTGLPPAVAMQPAAPTSYRSLLSPKNNPLSFLTQLDIMAFRHLVRWPIRSFLTTLGVSLSVALLITAFFSFDSIDYMIDSIFFRTNLQEATISFSTEKHVSVDQLVAAQPGILRAEGFRRTVAIARNGNHEARISLMGVHPDAALSRVLDLEGNPYSLPRNGIVLSEFVARKLKLESGDLTELELPDDGHRKASIPVVGISQGYMGLTGHMNLKALNRLLRDGDLVSSVNMAIDSNQISSLFKWVKNTPAISSLELNRISLQKFRDTIRQNIVIMMTVYVVLAIIITFGVVYNSARIQLSERARELASLRVLGFSRREVASVLLTEISTIILIAQPLGWVIGYLFAFAVVEGFESDLYRIPLIVSLKTLGLSSLVVVTAAIVSAAVVQIRVRHLDLVRVLKSRE